MKKENGANVHPIKNMKRKGNVMTLEFVIILIILTFFIFYPFALYSTYQTTDLLSSIKERGLQLVSTSGELTPVIAETLVNEFDFYGFGTKQGERIIITVYNITKDEGAYGSTLTSGKKTVLEIKTDTSGVLTGNIIHSGMTPALKNDRDNIRFTIEYPSDNFLNATLGMIGKSMENVNNTGAKLAFKSSGFIMSEYTK